MVDGMGDVGVIAAAANLTFDENPSLLSTLCNIDVTQKVVLIFTLALF